MCNIVGMKKSVAVLCLAGLECLFSPGCGFITSQEFLRVTLMFEQEDFYVYFIKSIISCKGPKLSIKRQQYFHLTLENTGQWHIWCSLVSMFQDHRWQR